jgi:hypothetical protein
MLGIRSEMTYLQPLLCRPRRSSQPQHRTSCWLVGNFSRAKKEEPESEVSGIVGPIVDRQHSPLEVNTDITTF